MVQPRERFAGVQLDDLAAQRLVAHAHHAVCGAEIPEAVEAVAGPHAVLLEDAQRTRQRGQYHGGQRACERAWTLMSGHSSALEQESKTHPQ